jgi:hypothetical protein
MIEALAANRSNHRFDIGTLPRRARCRQNFADTHVSYVFSEVIAKNSVTFAEQEAREADRSDYLAPRMKGTNRSMVYALKAGFSGAGESAPRQTWDLDACSLNYCQIQCFQRNRTTTPTAFSPCPQPSPTT